MNHTKEPWNIRRFNHGTFIHHEKEEICSMYFGKYRAKDQDANAQRIVDCVNALAGIENPKEVIPKMVEALEELIEAVETEDYGYISKKPIIEAKEALALGRKE